MAGPREADRKTNHLQCRDLVGSILGQKNTLEGNGYHSWCSCLENPMGEEPDKLQSMR